MKSDGGTRNIHIEQNILNICIKLMHTDNNTAQFIFVKEPTYV